MPLFVGLLILGILAFTVQSLGGFRLFGKTNDTNSLSTASKLPAPLLASPKEMEQPKTVVGESSSETPRLGVAGKRDDPMLALEGSRMPDDLRNWLRHLKRVDMKREEMNRKLAGELVEKALSIKPGTFTDIEELEADAERRKNTASQEISSLVPEFRELIREFHKLPPPTEAQPIAQEYDRALLAMMEMTQEIMNALAKEDLSALMSMLNSSYSRIDERVKFTNERVDQLCKKYNEPNVYKLYVETPSSGGTYYQDILKGLGGL
ncbi:MAG TPA: hypothetical protein VNK96_05755 [Fimbriimonadales bacterium]|nr:hypothetical protein [Fimbriimonadales bacterium]